MREVMSLIRRQVVQEAGSDRYEVGGGELWWESSWHMLCGFDNKLWAGIDVHQGLKLRAHATTHSASHFDMPLFDTTADCVAAAGAAAALRVLIAAGQFAACLCRRHCCQNKCHSYTAVQYVHRLSDCLILFCIRVCGIRVCIRVCGETSQEHFTCSHTSSG